MRAIRTLTFAAALGVCLVACAGSTASRPLSLDQAREVAIRYLNQTTGKQWKYSSVLETSDPGGKDIWMITLDQVGESVLIGGLSERVVEVDAKTGKVLPRTDPLM